MEQKQATLRIILESPDEWALELPIFEEDLEAIFASSQWNPALSTFVRVAAGNIGRHIQELMMKRNESEYKQGMGESTNAL